MPLIKISLPQKVSPPRKSRKVKIIIKTENSKAFATEVTARQRRNQRPLATEGTEITEPQIESSFIPLPRPRGRGRVRGRSQRKKVNKI